MNYSNHSESVWYQSCVFSVSFVVCLMVLSLWDLPSMLSEALFQLQAPRSTSAQQLPEQTLDTENLELSLGEFLSHEQTQAAADTFLGDYHTPLPYPVTTYSLIYPIQLKDGQTSTIRAQVFVPLSPNDQKFPLVVYGAGTTGIDDRCAPSNENQTILGMGNFRNQMIAQAAAGFVVVMPNYEGLDNPNRVHYYFDSATEAQTMLSAAEILTLSDSTKSLPIDARNIFFGGYSQGGHAAFAAADLATEYAPDLKIAGVFGHGPTTNIRDLLLNNPNLAPYFFAAYTAYNPDFSPEDFLSQEGIKSLNEAEILCVDEAFGTNTATKEGMYTPGFLRSLEQNEFIDNFSTLGQHITRNHAGLNYEKIPTLILQGDSDTVVPLSDQKRFVNQLCSKKVPVDLVVYQDLDHFTTRQHSFKDTNEWLRSVSNGEAIEVSC